MGELEEIYTREWFEHDFAPLQPEFNLVADGIVRVLAPRLAIDVGCGPGMLVRALRERGVNTSGFDGSQHALDYAAPEVRPFLFRLDIRDAENGVGIVEEQHFIPIDLLVCTEVAEHLEEQHAHVLVNLLTRGSPRYVLFTAAPPGQDGHHHVNCQPPAYWTEKFAVRGYPLDEAKTAAIKASWAPLQRLSHMTRNVMVFRRSS